MRTHRVNDYPAVMFTLTDRMEEILDVLLPPLDEQFDMLRAEVPSYPYETPERDDLRRLRSQLSTLEAEYWAISRNVNKEYHAMKPCWKKNEVLD